MTRSNLFAGIGFLLIMVILNSCSDDEYTIPPPANVMAVEGNGQATVSWQQSTAGLASETDGYVVVYQIGGGAGKGCSNIDNSSEIEAGYTFPGQGDSCMIACNVAKTQYSCLIMGLTNGASYTFIVISTGNGNSSFGTSNSIIPIGPLQLPLPPPTNVLAVAGNHQAFVSWKLPVGNGVKRGVTYQVDYFLNGLGMSCTTNFLNPGCNINEDYTVVGDSEGIDTINGLTNGLSFIFTVIAIPNIDNSDTSVTDTTYTMSHLASNTVTPLASDTATAIPKSN